MLGADRGAYTETDVRELARALTGFRRLVRRRGPARLPLRPLSRHDDGFKTVYGHRGAFGWQDAVRLVVEHPLHPSFFVAQAVVATSSRRRRRADVAAALERPTSTRATRSARCSRRSCAHPQLYDPDRRWSSRRSSAWPACCARSRPIARRQWVVCTTSRPAAATSRPTCRAGTTSAGSTRTRSAPAATRSPRCSTATPSRSTTGRPTRPRRRPFRLRPRPCRLGQPGGPARTPPSR